MGVYLVLMKEDKEMQLPLVLVVGLMMCAVDIQKPDGTRYIGSFVYTQAFANAFAEAQRAEYPSYIVTVRCPK